MWNTKNYRSKENPVNNNRHTPSSISLQNKLNFSSPSFCSHIFFDSLQNKPSLPTSIGPIRQSQPYFKSYPNWTLNKTGWYFSKKF